MTTIEARLEKLETQVATLSAEADIRRIVSRYMWLCDVPMPEPDSSEREKRIELIVDLYTEDAEWQGVGGFYTDQFGRKKGKEELRRHFQGFFEPRQPEMLLNVHFLTTEHIVVNGDEATGSWVHFQPWIFSDGTSLIRSSRLFNAFRKENGVWKMSRYRTENNFVAPLPDNWWESIPSESVLVRGGKL